jgi:hypothetical protein
MNYRSLNPVLLSVLILLIPTVLDLIDVGVHNKAW